MGRLETLAQRFAEITYPLLTGRGYAPGCCIAAVRIGIEVFEFFGYPAVEFPCTLWIPNRELVERLESGGWPESEWMAEGCYSVLIGHPDHVIPNGIRAHLILRVGNTPEAFFIDPTIPQGHRPQHGINLPTGVVFQSFDLAGGRDDCVRPRGAEIMLYYYPRKSDEHLSSPDWRTRRWKRLAGDIIRELQK